MNIKLSAPLVVALSALAPAGCRTADDGAGLAAADPNDCSLRVSSDGCTYYECLEDQIGCGDTGYPLGFGARYCAKFQGLCGGRLISDNARKWVQGTTKCLQTALNGFVNADKSCDQLTTFAFDSHPFCYTSGAAAISGVSFCTLRPAEWNQVRGCINLADTLSARGLRQAAVTASRCSQFFAGRLLLSETGADAGPDAATARLIAAMSPAERAQRAKELQDFADAIDVELGQKP